MGLSLYRVFSIYFWLSSCQIYTYKVWGLGLQPSSPYSRINTVVQLASGVTSFSSFIIIIFQLLILIGSIHLSKDYLATSE